MRPVLSQPDQIGALFTFLARQCARHGSRLRLSETLRNQVVEYLTTPGEQATDHEEKQQVCCCPKCTPASYLC